MSGSKGLKTLMLILWGLETHQYYKEIISDEEEGKYDQDQLVKIENVDDLKRAFHESL